MGSLPLDSVCYDGPLLRRISELHVWAVREGLCGTAPATLFEGLCRRLAGPGLHRRPSRRRCSNRVS
jgi:hypothetical protein